jgi:hypothetical protein
MRIKHRIRQFHEARAVSLQNGYIQRAAPKSGVVLSSELHLRRCIAFFRPPTKFPELNVMELLWQSCGVLCTVGQEWVLGHWPGGNEAARFPPLRVHE